MTEKERSIGLQYFNNADLAIKLFKLNGTKKNKIKRIVNKVAVELVLTHLDSNPSIYNIYYISTPLRVAFGKKISTMLTSIRLRRKAWGIQKIKEDANNSI